LTTPLTLNELIIWYKGRRKFGLFTDQHGLIETQYFGSQRGSQNATYHKKQAGTAEGILRVEQRVRKPFLGRDLHRVPNPFERLHIVATGDIEPALTGHVPAFFFAHARSHGISRATKMLPRKQADEIKTLMKQAENSVLPSLDKIWAVWPDTLVRAGFGLVL
jgi:hypothetical protein